jgi:6-pyruvoyltetrahydropterin/6-carboxytetrahydropterin synthase
MDKNKQVTITRKFEFSASHRYWRDEWSAEKNEQVFGRCISTYGHGHNYELHVTVGGQVNPETGMIINLTDLKKEVNVVLEDFDHKFLNLDTPWFRELVPTTENVAAVLFRLIDERLNTYPLLRLERIRLYEKHDLYAEIRRAED